MCNPRCKEFPRALPALASFSALVQLQLDSCRLRGPELQWLADVLTLPQLSALDLSRNGFEASPEELAAATQLRWALCPKTEVVYRQSRSRITSCENQMQMSLLPQHTCELS